MQGFELHSSTGKTMLYSKSHTEMMGWVETIQSQLVALQDRERNRDKEKEKEKDKEKEKEKEKEREVEKDFVPHENDKKDRIERSGED